MVFMELFVTSNPGSSFNYDWALGNSSKSLFVSYTLLTPLNSFDNTLIVNIFSLRHSYLVRSIHPGGVLQKQILKILQNSQENTCIRVSL